MLFLDFLFGFLGGFAGYFAISYLSTLLNQKQDGGIIKQEAGPKIPRLRQSSSKRTPRALTDLMAYQKEIEEEGHNRG